MQHSQSQSQSQSQPQHSHQPGSSNGIGSTDIPASRSHASENNNNNINSHTIDNHTQSQSPTPNGSFKLAEQSMPQKLPLPLLPQKQPQHQHQHAQPQSQILSPPFDSTTPPRVHGHGNAHEHVHDNNVGNLSTTQKKFLLSTSSPEGMQVASKITPTRLANLLIKKGPLPIRHITAQLTLEVPSFELLSLSKQRRLIMAAMEQVDPTNNVVFEKIGWGQWAVRKVDSDYIVTEGTEQREQREQQQQHHVTGTPQSVSPEGQDASYKKKLGKQLKPHSVDSETKVININDLRNQTNLKLGWSKNRKDGSGSGSGSGSGGTSTALDKNGARRESITNSVKNLHNIRLPNERIDNAIASDSEDEDDDRFKDLEEEEDEDEVDFDDDDDDDDISGLDERLIRNGRHKLNHQRGEDEPLNSSDQDAVLDDEDEEMFAFDETAIKSASQHHKSKPKKSSPPLRFANRVPSKVSPPPISSTASSYDGKAAARRRKSSSSAPSSVTKPSALRHYHATHHPHHTHLLNNPTFITRSRLNSIENLESFIASTSSGRNSTVSISSPPPAIAFNYSSAGLGGNSESVGGSGEAIDVRSAVFGASPVSASNTSPVGSWGSNTGGRHYIIHNEEAAKANKSRRKSSFNESHERSTLNSIRQQLKSSSSNNQQPLKQQQQQQQQHHQQLSSSSQQQLHQRSSSVSSDTDEEDWQSIGPEFLRQQKHNTDVFEVKNELEVGESTVKVENSNQENTAVSANANEEERSAAFALVNLMSV
ncbi:STB3 [Candida theae]|uniref:STB3 n=1 Tax=Candida theae TaxID=1198502 RepID=A0AAD5BB75_9ASCO|nr:STB3 [Candida theae]KAI5949492.1 STB3 [Candida theae]